MESATCCWWTGGLVGWWLFAAGLLALVVVVLRQNFAVWALMWLPFLLVMWVALPPLQALRQQLAELQEFQLQCHPYDPPSSAFLAYKQQRWLDTAPYFGMLAAITLLYIPAIVHLVRVQRT